jgi:Protein of unknown function (DUF3072)
MYLLDKTEKPRMAGDCGIMQKKKTSEAQVQQEMSSSAATFGRSAWTPTREPMTGAQADSLRRLAEEIKEPQAFNEGLSRSEAERRIYRLRERLRLGNLPPHTD